jgi:hypothetical protein
MFVERKKGGTNWRGKNGGDAGPACLRADEDVPTRKSAFTVEHTRDQKNTEAYVDSWRKIRSWRKKEKRPKYGSRK